MSERTLIDITTYHIIQPPATSWSLFYQVMLLLYTLRCFRNQSRHQTSPSCDLNPNVDLPVAFIPSHTTDLLRMSSPLGSSRSPTRLQPPSCCWDLSSRSLAVAVAGADSLSCSLSALLLPSPALSLNNEPPSWPSAGPLEREANRPSPPDTRQKHIPGFLPGMGQHPSA